MGWSNGTYTFVEKGVYYDLTDIKRICNVRKDMIWIDREWELEITPLTCGP